MRAPENRRRPPPPDVGVAHVLPRSQVRLQLARRRPEFRRRRRSAATAGRRRGATPSYTTLPPAHDMNRHAELRRSFPKRAGSTRSRSCCSRCCQRLNAPAPASAGPPWPLVSCGRGHPKPPSCLAAPRSAVRRQRGGATPFAGGSRGHGHGRNRRTAPRGALAAPAETDGVTGGQLTRCCQTCGGGASALTAGAGLGSRPWKAVVGPRPAARPDQARPRSRPDALPSGTGAWHPLRVGPSQPGPTRTRVSRVVGPGGESVMRRSALFDLVLWM